MAIDWTTGVGRLPGLAMGAEDREGTAQERSLGGGGIHGAGADLRAGGVDHVGEESEQPVWRKFGVKRFAALAANDQRADRLQGRF